MDHLSYTRILVLTPPPTRPLIALQQRYPFYRTAVTLTE